jgi:Zn-dependent peptidase ImmA (M78 family)
MHRYVSTEELGSYSKFSVMEQQADAFASAFLMPAATFADEFVSSLDGLRDLKRRWLVSIGAMVMRGRQLNLISEIHERNLWRLIGRRKWRTREPLDDLLPVEEPEFVRRSITLLERRHVSSARDIAFQLGLSTEDLVELCSIDSRMELQLQVMTDDQQDATNTEYTKSDAGISVIPFPRE